MDDVGDVVLETERLVLRRFAPTEADIDALVELDADPRVTHFITGGEPTPRETVAGEVIPAFLAQYRRWASYGFFATIDRESRRFIGWFHLRPSPDGGADDEPELGYRLRHDAWGRGYATEASRALIDMAFSRLGAARVWAATMAVNAASRRVMEKSGMRFVRAFHADWPYRIPGEEHGDVEYAITRLEWEADRDA